MPTVNPPDLTQSRLLQSIVEVARSFYGAAAASVFLVDDQTGDLVFEAVAGNGIAGWTVMCGQPLLIDDVSDNPQFSRDAAESTGYVPQSIMAAPLFHDGDCIGVLEVLDRDSQPRCDLGDLDAIGLLATETAAALALLVRLRSLESEFGGENGGAAAMPLLRRVADRLPTASGQVSATVTKLLVMADELLTDGGAGAGALGA
jgi:GAF domain-containing protein